MSQGDSTPTSAFQALEAGMRMLAEGARAETGQTPKEVIWSRNKARLYHYLPVVTQQLPVPILLVYALINRPYILDLMPGNSFVEYLVGEGFQVYLLDWGIPGDEDAALSFDHYVLDYLPAAVRNVLRHAHAEELTLFGYCMGGTMAAMYAALFPDKPLKNLVLLTTPIAFPPDQLGLLGLWTRAEYFDPERVIAAYGNAPAALIDHAMRMLKPVTNYVGTYVTMWDRLRQDRPMDTWLAMNTWVTDGIPMAAATFRQWIRDFYQRNLLAEGELRLRGQRVRLTNISCPVLIIAGKRDHICPMPQTEATMTLIGSQDRTFLALDAGHVGLLTGSDARSQMWPNVRNWLLPRST